MAKYAYRDKVRKDIIYSNSAIEEDRNKVFFVLSLQRQMFLRR